MSDSTGTAWIVQRKYDPERGWYDPDGEAPVNPRDQFWAVYETEEEANRSARELDHAEMIVNGTTEKVFAGGLEAATTFPEYALRDWLLDRDIPVPDGNTITAWRLWWQKVKDADRPISRDQFRHVLAGLNKLPLSQYEVVAAPRPDPAPLPAVGYAVVYRHWRYDDDTYQGDNEPLGVYRTREAADAEAARRTAGPVRPYWNPDYREDVSEYVVVELPLCPEG